jgi:signal peptidase II
MPDAPRAAGRMLPWLAVAAVVIVLDRVTKALVEARFRYGERLPVLDGFFDLVLVYNTGAAFSFLSDAGGWQRPFFIAVAVAASALILFLLRRHAAERWFALGLALILGGALGNLYDRVVLGHVVDFLLFHWRGWHYPAFNVADSAITVGAAILIIDGLRGGSRERTQNA